ncbi:uncharacterized protein TNCV_4320301 [Trichonephila clavipes]|nr:uncharacterized protein TNCV_4320301 [Trichonephila clavipes]
MENMQRSQERMENMQRSQEETKNELKEGMQKGLEDMQKGQERMQKCQEDLKNALEKKIDNVEEKINSVEEKIALKVEEKIVVVEEKIEKKVEQVEERIREQVERIEEVAGNFSQRVEDLEKKLLACEKMSENKFVPTSAVPGPLPHQGEAAEVLQTLPDIERLNLNSLYNALDLRFGQKYPKEYASLQTKTRLQKTRESLQEYVSEVERLGNLAFSDHPATVSETISLQYFVDGLREGEVQKAVRMADVQDLKSALKLEAATQANLSEELE